MIEHKAQDQQERHLLGIGRVQLLYKEIRLSGYPLSTTFSAGHNTNTAQIAGIATACSQLSQLHDWFFDAFWLPIDRSLAVFVVAFTWWPFALLLLTSPCRLAHFFYVRCARSSHKYRAYLQPLLLHYLLRPNDSRPLTFACSRRSAVWFAAVRRR